MSSWKVVENLRKWAHRRGGYKTNYDVALRSSTQRFWAIFQQSNDQKIAENDNHGDVNAQVDKSGFNLEIGLKCFWRVVVVGPGTVAGPKIAWIEQLWLDGWGGTDMYLGRGEGRKKRIVVVFGV